MESKKITKKVVKKASKPAPVKTSAVKLAVKAEAKKAVQKPTKFAVIHTGGKQYLVGLGEILKIEKITGLKKDCAVNFDKVLLVIDGDNVKIGNPLVTGAKVSGKVEEEGRAKKIMVIRYKSKTRYSKKKGHRQPYLKVKITEIK